MSTFDRLSLLTLEKNLKDGLVFKGLKKESKLMSENEIQVINKYNFEKNLSRMKSDFGSIQRGQEDEYTFELFTMEETLLKFHKKNPNINGNHALNAIRICLLKANGYLNDITFEYSSLVDPVTLELGNRLAQTFIPFENKNMLAVIEKTFDIQSKEGLGDFFSTPIKCLIRIASSVEFWEKQRGTGGYFKFLYEQIAPTINFEDDEVNFFVKK
jgi:hypothetical protein